MVFSDLGIFVGGVFEDVEEHAARDERGVLDVGALDAAGGELEVVESEEEWR